MSFDGKVVIITGASSGIGAATAKAFAARGASVVINGRNETKLVAVASEIAQIAKPPLVVKADISEDESAKKLINDTVTRFGKIDILVNNAGFGGDGIILDGSILQAYDVIMATNVRAVVHLTSLAAPHLVKTKGNIINISSVAGSRTPFRKAGTAYNVSKAALNHFSKAAALEFSEHGVRVNIVSPGPVLTDFTVNSKLDYRTPDMAKMMPLKRVAQPEEIADVILFLADEKAVGITGSEFVSDCGYLVRA